MVIVKSGLETCTQGCKLHIFCAGRQGIDVVDVYNYMYVYVDLYGDS